MHLAREGERVTYVHKMPVVRLIRSLKTNEQVCYDHLMIKPSLLPRSTLGAETNILASVLWVSVVCPFFHPRQSAALTRMATGRECGLQAPPLY